MVRLIAPNAEQCVFRVWIEQNNAHEAMHTFSLLRLLLLLTAVSSKHNRQFLLRDNGDDLPPLFRPP